MAAVGIGEEFIEEIAPSRAVPEVVVRIDDRQIRFKDGFVAPIQPVLAHGKIGGR
jgi:hypothetical protein